MVCEGSVRGRVVCAGSLGSAVCDGSVGRRVVCGSAGIPPVGRGRPSLGIGMPEGKSPGGMTESVAVGRDREGSDGAPVTTGGSTEICETEGSRGAPGRVVGSTVICEAEGSEVAPVMTVGSATT